VEEGDFGLIQLAGAAESARASTVLHDLFTRWNASGVVNSFFGRRLPGLVSALGLDSFGVDVVTPTGGPGHPAYETVRMAWPATRAGFAASGTPEDDLHCLDKALTDSTYIVGITTFAVWGQLPR
jgi:hypothetical protein